MKSNNYQLVSEIVWCDNKDCDKLYFISKEDEDLNKLLNDKILPCGHKISKMIFNIDGSFKKVCNDFINNT